MKREIKILGIAISLLFSIFLPDGCKSSTETAAKNIHPTDTVIIRQMQFIPAELKVKKGDTVVWINKDMVEHTVASERRKMFYSDTLPVGASWKLAASDSATYFCTIHPTMKGKLVLK